MNVDQLIDKISNCRYAFINSTQELPLYVSVSSSHELPLKRQRQHLTGHPEMNRICGMELTFCDQLQPETIVVSGHKLEIY